jgi:PAS domain S-box-containing protein
MGASQGVSGYVVKTGKPQIINNVKTYPRYIKYFDEVQSELCVPLKHKEKVIGVIDIESEKLNAFNERHLKLVQNLAAFASIAIENARAYEESEQWASHLQAIQRLALELNKTLDVKFLANKVVSGLRKVISADDCRFYILNEETKELIPLAQKGSSQAYKFPSLEVLRLKVGEGITGVVAKTGKPLAIPDAKIHPHSKLIPGTKDIDESMLICPLIFENKVKGVISLSKLGLNRFSEGDLRLLMIFSSHAAIALENAKLYEVRMSQLNEIHKLKDFNENIVNSLDEGIWIEDKNGVATFVNPQLARITGLNCQDLAGQHWSKIFAPRFHNIIRNETEKRFQGISSRYEAALLNKDGEEVPILISAIPLFSDEGIEGVLAAITDISELKKMEMKMVRSARLGALGEMAGGVAHDFNNILGAILGRVQLLMRKTTDPNILNGLKIIEKASIDGGETVRRVQNFTRVRTFEKFVMISINELLHDAVTMTQARWKEFAEATGIKIKIEEHYSPVPNLAGNPSELREVFTNLIINAVDALPQGGTIGIETGYFDNQISISISDDGVGIPKEIIDKIFDPFFTTKGVRGTGLGLSVSYGIISRHHGDILVKSTVGKGSVFTIMLPVVKADKEEDKSELVSFISSPKLKVVVIDDEEHLRDLLADILGVDGHSVFTAPGGKEGLELVEQHNPDIVFTDLGMPYISGWEVVKAVKERNSGTPVVMVTGWGDQLDKKKITEMKVDAVIAKPFQVNQIIETLQKVVLRK